MDSIPKNEILEFPDDVLQVIRKEYDLDKPGRMDQAIDALEEWTKKQNHFIKKNFPRDYLERKIIFSKGSVERAKKKMDRLCTLKTLVPYFFETMNLKVDYKDSNILLDALLPKLTNDYYRIYLLKNNGQRFLHEMIYYFRFIVLLCMLFTEMKGNLDSSCTFLFLVLILFVLSDMYIFLRLFSDNLSIFKTGKLFHLLIRLKYIKYSYYVIYIGQLIKK